MAASNEAIDSLQKVALLTQALEGEKDVNKDQSARLSKLENEVAKSLGAEEARVKSSNSSAKWIGPVVSGLLFALSLGVGGGIYGKLGEIDRKSDDVSNMLAGFEERLKFIEAKKAPDLAGLLSDQAKFDTRIATIEASLGVHDSNNVRRDLVLNDLSKQVAALESQLQAARERNSNNTTTIAELKEQAVINLRNIAAIDAKASAGFVEVESQLRGIQAMFIGAIDASDRIMGTVWQKVMGQPLPDSKPLPTNIPAQAITTIGGSATSN